MSSFSRYMQLPQGKALKDRYEPEAPEESVDCIVCGSPERRLWYSVGKFNAFICGACSTRYVSPRLSRRQLDSYYTETLFTKSKDFEGVPHNMLDPKERERKRRDMKIEIDAALSRFPNGGKVLDVGCQTGIFLEALPDIYEKVGIERSEWAADHCRKIIKGRILTGCVEDVSLDSGCFDLINISFVVEHLEAPKKTLAQISRWQRPGGTMTVSVPNFMSPCSLIFKEFYRLAEPRQHVYLTSPASLRRLLSSVGYSVESIHYPYWGTPYCNLRQLSRLLSNGARRLLLPILLEMGVAPRLEQLVSPPFWGNIMTVVAKKNS